MARIAELFAQALGSARLASRLLALEEAARICDQLAKAGTWEHTLGAAECANRIRSKLNGKTQG